ncbi:unnamed protein product [Somion occarium]|uniref:Uncharacterized protein n=1 Tax=Somion occarium TaxID=3059160 RepID=A0ABP1E5I1_9APHY
MIHLPLIDRSWIKRKAPSVICHKARWLRYDNVYQESPNDRVSLYCVRGVAAPYSIDDRYTLLLYRCISETYCIYDNPPCETRSGRWHGSTHDTNESEIVSPLVVFMTCGSNIQRPGFDSHCLLMTRRASSTI